MKKPRRVTEKAPRSRNSVETPVVDSFSPVSDANEARLRLILESSLDAVVTINEAGGITGWNSQATIMFGWKHDEVIGRLMADLIVPEQYRESHRKGLQRFLATGEGPLLNKRVEITALCKGGEEIPIEMTISPLQFGDHYEFSAFIRSITERKRLEEIFRNINDELERHVEQRTAELARSNEQLELSNLELRRFAHIASHDLQSPLRSISGFVQLLQRNYQGKLDERADSWMQRVVEGTRTMHTLIQDLLSYSHIDSAARSHKPTDLRAVFNDAVISLDGAIRERGATVTCDALPTIDGDRSQLLQLLQNLIDNGIKYHGDDPPRIHVAAEMDGDEWIFSVHDNGIGIDPTQRERIFDIFHRLHTKQAYPGTGIGLAICRRVVQHHDGSIWVESQPGKGSVFYFTLGNRLGPAT